VKQLEDALQASQEAERAARAAAEAAEAERDAAAQREALAKAQAEAAHALSASLEQTVASRDQRLALLEAEAREGAAALQASHNNVRALQGPCTPRAPPGGAGAEGATTDVRPPPSLPCPCPRALQTRCRRWRPA